MLETIPWTAKANGFMTAWHCINSSSHIQLGVQHNLLKWCVAQNARARKWLRRFEAVAEPHYGMYLSLSQAPKSVKQTSKRSSSAPGMLVMPFTLDAQNQRNDVIAQYRCKVREH